jgi:hypothetical protein
MEELTMKGKKRQHEKSGVYLSHGGNGCAARRRHELRHTLRAMLAVTAL